MKEFLAKIINFIEPAVDKINSFVHSFAKSEKMYGAYIAIVAIALILITFIIALFIQRASRLKAFASKVKDANSFVKQIGLIDKDNVEGLNARLQTMPRPVVKGWASFLDQQIGYPSDYITERDVFADPVASPKHFAGRTFFKLVSIIVVLLSMAVAAIACKDVIASLASNPASVNKFTQITLMIIAAIFAPLIVYVIFLAIINLGYKRQKNKLYKNFIELQDILDANVILFKEQEDEFVSENIQEINAAIEHIIASKLDQSEILEIITTPKIESEPIVEEQPIFVPEEEIVASAEANVLTEEQERSYLEQLIAIVDAAIKDVQGTTAKDLEDLAVIIATAKDTGFKNDIDQDVLDNCLRMLAEVYYR